jgi:hypothetical protein
MDFLRKVSQHLSQFERSRSWQEDGLINTTDLLVATAATVVLAAGIGGAAISALDEAKYGKAQPDAQTIAQGIQTFYKDTGKWPGQSYHAQHTGEAVILATGARTTMVDNVPTFTTGSSVLPSIANNGLKWASMPSSSNSGRCGQNSGQGFVNATGVATYTSSMTTVEITGVTVLDLNDYLVRDPGPSYPKWKGPYVQEISSDPWERSWVAYLLPLYCSEDITGTATGGGNLGYAWLFSGGANRTITTPAADSQLDEDGDDTGVNLGKLTVHESVVSQ